MSPVKNLQMLLDNRPTGMVSSSNFRFNTGEIDLATIPEGSLLLKTLFISVDPAWRGWLNDQKSYIPPVKIGEVMRAQTVCQVVVSKHKKFTKGTFVVATAGCQEYFVSNGKGIFAVTPLPGHPLSAYLSVLGVTGLSAYFGLLDVGKPKEGETVLVSGAAGGVGSIVGQIAQIKGCKVVGVAGSDEKCKWLVEELGFSAAINYKKEPNLIRAIRKACPQGVDVFFDNVGGDILDAALRNLRTRGRVVLCGAISTYNQNQSTPPAGPKFYMSLLVNRGRMEGFVLTDYWSKAGPAIQELAGWVMQGKLKYREHIEHGIENCSNALLKLFDGSNTGKMIVKVADPMPVSKL